MIPKPLKQWFATPVFPGDDDKTRLAKILHVMLWSLWFFTLFISPLYLNKLWRPLLLFIGITGSLYLLQRGYVHAARDLLFILMVAILNIFAWTAGGIYSMSFPAYVIVVVCAALFYRLTAVLIVIGIGILNGLAMVLAARYHILPISKITHSPELVWLIDCGIFVTLALAINLTKKHLQTALHNSQRELSERQQAEHALRESEKRYRQLVELSPNGIFVHQHGQLVYVNQAGIDLMGGATADELLGKPIIEYVHPDYRKIVKQRIQRAVQEGQPSPFVEEQFLKLDGTPIVVRVAAIPIMHQGQPAVQVVALDISAQKLAEAKIRSLNAELESRVKQRTTELEFANRELKDFAYVVSHDLKAPLRAISRLAFWLREDYAPAFDEKGDEMVDLLIGRVKRMDNLINGILEYSRIGRMENACATVDLNEVLAEVIDSLAPPEHVHITVIHELPTIVVSRICIFQVFQNLLGNAIKFSDQALVNITIDCIAEEGFWKFSVADNGPGIDPKYHDRIFQIFQTLHSRDEFESTGIGLTLVKKVIELYGGKVWVESTPGTGCQFFFTFPRQESC